MALPVVWFTGTNDITTDSALQDQPAPLQDQTTPIMQCMQF